MVSPKVTNRKSPNHTAVNTNVVIGEHVPMIVVKYSSPIHINRELKKEPVPKPCYHRCKDKTECKHACCKIKRTPKKKATETPTDTTMKEVDKAGEIAPGASVASEKSESEMSSFQKTSPNKKRTVSSSSLKKDKSSKKKKSKKSSDSDSSSSSSKQLRNSKKTKRDSRKKHKKAPSGSSSESSS